MPMPMKDLLTNSFFSFEKPQINSDTEAYLRGLYRKDVLQLQDLIDRNLEHWL